MVPAGLLLLLQLKHRLRVAHGCVHMQLTVAGIPALLCQGLGGRVLRRSLLISMRLWHSCELLLMPMLLCGNLLLELWSMLRHCEKALLLLKPKGS